MNWFIEHNGMHWVRCEILSNVLGMVTVQLYNGERRTGRARRGSYGLLVEAKP